MRSSVHLFVPGALLALLAACDGSVDVGEPAPAWTQIPTAGATPPARQDGATLAGLTVPILFAGYESSGPANDVWALGAGSSWTEVEATGELPTARFNHGAVYDAVNDRMMIFGGCEGGCLPVASDIWVLTGAAGTAAAPAWTRLSPSGSIAGRQSFAMAYDATYNRVIIFGGQNGGGESGETLSDVSVLTNANGLGGTPVWSQLVQTGDEAPGQYGPAAGYDSVDARLIVMGGAATGTGTETNAVYVLSNANGVAGATANWTNLIAEGAAGSPPAGQNRLAAYDSASNRFVQLGGAAPSDVWVLSNANGAGGAAAWTQLSIPTGPGAGLAPQAQIYDPATGTLTVLFSGTISGVTVNQLWQLANAFGR